jgi:alanine dehydrogenase
MKYLDDDQIKDLLDNKFGQVIDAIESAFLNKTAEMVPKVYLNAHSDGDFRAMPAALESYAVLKWIGVFPNNKQFNLPTTIGTLLLNDRFTGKPLMAMDCTTLTAYRTAATSAIAAKYCASKAKNFAIIGCGLQAKYHIDAYNEVFGTNIDIQFFDRSQKAQKDMMCWLGKNLAASSYGRNESVKQAVRDADVVTTLTPSTKPYLDILDLKSGCHVNAVGADAVGKRELMPNVIDGAGFIVCDDLEQALHSGELQYNVWPNLEINNISSVIKNKKAPNKGISVFDSTGVAIEDIAIAELIYRLSNDYKTK